MSCRKEIFNFGTIEEGTVLNVTYAFTNIGKEPLIIYDVQTGCGCTVARWPNQPIKISSTDSIVVKFNSSNKRGKQNRVITVLSNSVETVKILSFEGNVIEKKRF